MLCAEVCRSAVVLLSAVNTYYIQGKRFRDATCLCGWGEGMESPSNTVSGLLKPLTRCSLAQLRY